MPDPGQVASPWVAEGLVLVCEDWLRRRARDGELPLGPVVRAGLARTTTDARHLAACCPLLLRAVGP